MKTFSLKTAVAAIVSFFCGAMNISAQVDMTNKITNPSFEDGWTGWTNSGMQRQSNDAFMLKEGAYYVEKWVPNGNAVGSGSVWQTINNLPAGVYTITVKAQNIQVDTEVAQSGVYLIANNDTTAITFAGEYSVSTVCVDGTLRIGFVLDNATGNYVCVDDFHLTQDDMTDETRVLFLAEVQKYIDYVEGKLSRLKEYDKPAVENFIAVLKGKISANSVEGVDDVMTSLRAIIDKYMFSIVMEKSQPVTFENDSIYPWKEENGVLISSTSEIYEVGQSSVKMYYEAKNKSCIVFDCRNNHRYYFDLLVYVDGNAVNVTNDSPWTTNYIFVEEGEHVIEFIESRQQSWTGYNWYCEIRNLAAYDLSSSYIASFVLSEGSLPMTFSCEGENSWIPAGSNELQSMSPSQNDATSGFSATFIIDKPCMLSWNERMETSDSYDYYYDYHHIDVWINDGLYHSRAASGNNGASVCLVPGEYTIWWIDWNRYSNSRKTYISNIKLTDQFEEYVDVTLSEPGQLGYESLRLMDPSKELTDIQFLKVHGTMNEKDWSELAMMTRLYGADLSDAKFDAVPNNAFNKTPNLSYLILPDGVKTIGNQAFTSTQLLNLDVPSSVTSIGTEAFKDVRIQHVNFKEDSQLTTIGYQAFYNCYSLLEFDMPNTVTTLRLYNNNTDYSRYEANTFRNCTRMKKLHISDALTCIPRYAFRDCSAVEEVNIPEKCTIIYYGGFEYPSSLKSIVFNDKLNTIDEYAFNGSSSLHKIELPESLKSINAYGFQGSALDSLILPVRMSWCRSNSFNNCSNLKYVELPSTFSRYDGNLCSNCKNLKTVVCKSPTPPTVGADPFNGSTVKSQMTLIVPEYALPNYKLDSYWYQFGEKKTLDIELDYWRIAGNLVLGDGNRMGGRPDLDVYYGGKLTVSGNDPMPVKNLDLFVSESNAGQLLNNCGQFIADSITSRFSVAKNTWYFITPMHDVLRSEVKHSANADFVFRYYDSERRAANGTGGSWQNVTGDTLYAGKGYIYQCNQDGELIMPAIKETQANVFNMAEVTFPLTAYESANAANANWNFTGNPYPCNYDIWYMDFTAPITIRNGNNYEAKTVTDDNYVLRPMQPFFVQKPNDVDKIVFRHEGRQTSSTVNRTSQAPARTAAERTRFLFNLELTDGEQTDQTRVVFNNQARMGYELECDASKFMSDDPRMPQIYSIDSEGTPMAINERPEQDGVVCLGIHIGTSGTYTIRATRADAAVTLYDALTRETIDLTTDSYTFTCEAGDYTDRFYLNASTLPTALETIDGKIVNSPLSPKGCLQSEAGQELSDSQSNYNLQGQKVSESYKGIVVKKGQKVINK